MKQEKTSWDFSRVYADNEAYEKDYQKLQKMIEELAGFDGKLNSENALLEFFKKSEVAEDILAKIYTYSSMKYDQNQKSSDGQKLHGRALDIYMKYIQCTSFTSSQILANGSAQLLDWAKKEEFKDYAYTIRRLVSNQDHIKSELEEKIMANYSPVINNFSDLYDMAAVADGKDNEVTFSDGEKAVVTHANFITFLEGKKNQDDRRLAFEAIYKPYYERRNTFAGIYNGIVLSNIAEMKSRGYSSILNTFLQSNDIPESVYLSLLETVHKNAHIVWDYYKLKQTQLGLKTFHTYDRFQKLASTTKKYTYEEAKKVFFTAAEKLGPDFVEKAKAVLEDGRVDVYYQEGKRTGAYSTGFYDKGPFILLNYNDSFNDVFTVAHEAGHSIHTMLANENNGIFNSNYTIFVAEIASTFNEQLLQDYFMEQDLDHETKLYMLQSACDDIIATFYRQTLFADYEYQAHCMALNGGVINADSLEQLMTKLYKEYYNIDLNNEPYKNDIWAYIPHLYHSPFYVYQYATCLACSLDIYDMVKRGVSGAKENYFKMLKAGGSDFPMNIVKLGGVDLTTPAPFEAVFKRLSFLVEELKKELKRK